MKLNKTKFLKDANFTMQVKENFIKMSDDALFLFIKNRISMYLSDKVEKKADTLFLLQDVNEILKYFE